MNLSGPSWWWGPPLCSWCCLLLSPKPCQPQVPLSLAQRPAWAFPQLCPGCWSTQASPPPLPHMLLSSALEELWAAAPAQATAAGHTAILCAHDPRVPSVGASQICLGKPLSSQLQRHKGDSGGRQKEHQLSGRPSQGQLFPPHPEALSSSFASLSLSFSFCTTGMIALPPAWIK